MNLKSQPLFSQFSSIDEFGQDIEISLDSNNYFKIGLILDTLENVRSLNQNFERKYFQEKNMKIKFNEMNSDQIAHSLVLLYPYSNYITTLSFQKCHISELPYEVSNYILVNNISFIECDSLKNISNFIPVSNIISVAFINSKISKLPVGVEYLNPFLRLIISLPEDFTDMNLTKELKRFDFRKNILSLYIRYKQCKIFPEEILNFSPLQFLVFFSKYINKYPYNLSNLTNLQFIYLSSNNIKSENIFDNLNDNRYLFYKNSMRKLKYYKLIDYEDSYELSPFDSDLYFLKTDVVDVFYSNLPICSSPENYIEEERTDYYIYIKDFSFILNGNIHSDTRKEKFVIANINFIFRINKRNNKLLLEFENLKRTDSFNAIMTINNTKQELKLSENQIELDLSEIFSNSEKKKDNQFLPLKIKINDYEKRFLFIFE